MSYVSQSVWLFATPWTAAHQAVSITNSQSLLKLTSIELVMPSNHQILCHPLLLPPSIFPSIRGFSNESTLCHPKGCGMTGFPFLHYLPEFAQIHIHWVSDGIQPSHPLSPPFPPALNLSWHPVSQLFTSGGQSIGVSASASVPPMNTLDWFPLELTGLISLLSKGLSRVFSKPQFKSINSLVLSFLHSPILTLYMIKKQIEKV